MASGSPSRWGGGRDDVVLERRRLVGQAHPHVAEPFAHVDVDEAVGGAVDVRHLRQVRRCDELAVETVGPRVVGALERSLDLAALLRAQARAAMAADVQEGPDATVLGATDDHALPAHLHGLERAGLVQVGRADGAEPHLLEDPLLFQGEDHGVRVGGARQRRDQAGGKLGRGHRRPFIERRSSASGVSSSKVGRSADQRSGGQLRMRAIVGSNSGSAVTVAGSSSPKYSTATRVPATAAARGSQA